MGMYDTFWGKYICPGCNKEIQFEEQTKDYERRLEDFKLGDYIDKEDLNMRIEESKKLQMILLGIGLGMALFEILLAISYLIKGRPIVTIALMVSTISLIISLHYFCQKFNITFKKDE